ncbi:MAG: anthranilate phosphoribosyltransferase, partial [Candidatus Acidiferrales bacterium]
LDEISLSGETHIADVREGGVRSYTVTPEDFGLERAPLESLRGGDAAENAAIIRRVLEAQRGACREIVLANAAAALVAAGAAADFREGTRLAARSIDTGGALQKLGALVEFTNP